MRWWDAAAAHALEKVLFPDPWSAETFWSELAHVPETRYYLVAEDDGGLAGYAGLAVVAGQADVQTLAVAADRQGQGLGRLLLDDLVAEARRRGAGAVLLEVRAENERAQALYRGAGFERIGLRRGYYQPGQQASIWFNVVVPDIAETYKKAMAEGCQEIQAVTELPDYGVSNAIFADPFGHAWMLHQIHREVSFEERVRLAEEG
jgi:ribosomal-protein-alanine N-acetyltransferase